jgi:hypothetical protein
MATGTAVIDFGSFPGKSDASVVITGQAGIAAGSQVEAWLSPADTADHSIDEHLMVSMKVVATSIVEGVGFTIFGLNSNAIQIIDRAFDSRRPTHRNAPMLSGQWSVAWVWV